MVVIGVGAGRGHGTAIGHCCVDWTIGSSEQKDCCMSSEFPTGSYPRFVENSVACSPGVASIARASVVVHESLESPAVSRLVT